MIECVIGALLAGACCLAQRQHRLERHNFFCFDSSPKPTPASEDCMNTPQLTSRECNEGKKLESLETNANVKVGIEAEMMERTKALRGRSGLDSLCGRPRNGAAFPSRGLLLTYTTFNQGCAANLHHSCFSLQISVLMVAANYI